MRLRVNVDNDMVRFYNPARPNAWMVFLGLIWEKIISLCQVLKMQTTEKWISFLPRGVDTASAMVNYPAFPAVRSSRSKTHTRLTALFPGLPV